MNQHYDLIVIGTGAGGGTVVHELAPTGKKILVLERGDFLPREKENWSPEKVYQDHRYYTEEQWCDQEGETVDPQTCYWVGGNTKVYGAALLLMRERDFDEVEHKGGISPAWELKYQDFAPYYTQAEKLFNVHGKKGQDPTEPKRDEYPYPPVSHEPQMQTTVDSLKQLGYSPFNLPVGLKLNEVDRSLSQCIRCDTCDGFPCLVDGKADAEVNCINPTRKYDNVTLMTGAKVLKLHTNSTGKEVTGVETDLGDRTEIFSGNLVVVACGAINSAALLLRSANDSHPNGLANSSDQVGRNFMKHLATTIVALSDRQNETVYQKTIGLNDFYWGEPDFPYPMGMVQNTGNVKAGMIPAEAPPLLAPFVKFSPEKALEIVAQHSTGWWLQTEDLPDPNNRVRWAKDRVGLDYTPNNLEARDRLIHRWTETLKAITKSTKHVIPLGIYPRSYIPLSAVGHQCGTCRFGEDASTSVLNLDCRTHDVENLYVVDSSFFPSNSGVNPTLTIIANAIRVAEQLKQLI
ncbi:GMC oxidoreductase [Pleurocapsa sp. PCC 7319]|uniref:GMC oxidoreductase n=1 Tax=Pleurocapsa sp. PCC 7319 TaxID=118161 RepID=UPI000349706C|nr:GMC family oxidoreductase [Pleurocapsa sp. PCC 7319]